MVLTIPKKNTKIIMTHWDNSYPIESNKSNPVKTSDNSEKIHTHTILLDPKINHIVISASEKYDTILEYNNRYIIPDSVTKLSIQGLRVKCQNCEITPKY